MSYKYIDRLVERRPQLDTCRFAVESICDILIDSYKNGGKILVCGNGGSASDAAHIVGEMMKGFLKRRELSIMEKEQFSMFGSDGKELAENLQSSLGAIDLTAFHALSTAISNDMNADYIYAQCLLGLGKPEDVFIGISTSGNARNVHLAAITAKERGLKLVGLTGASSGKMKVSRLYDVLLQVPESDTYRIQEEHIAVYHAICMTIEEKMFQE